MDNYSKPGTSIHTPEWDNCIQQVQNQGGVNGYAVCTAQMGEESFKSEFRHLSYVKSQVSKAKKAMGIGFAGPIPESLLARQDLEGDEKTNKSDTVSSNKLEQLKEKAEDAETIHEKSEVLGEIKDEQKKKQKAALTQRGADTMKSFLEYWKNVSKAPGYQNNSKYSDSELKDVLIEMRDNDMTREAAIQKVKGITGESFNRISQLAMSITGFNKTSIQKDRLSMAEDLARDLIAMGKSKDEIIRKLISEFEMDYGQAEYAYNGAK